MNEQFVGFLICLPLVLALVATSIAWRIIAHRALFLVLGTLAVLGLQQLFAPGVIFVLFSFSELAGAAAHQAYAEIITIGAVVETVLAIPLLWWFARSLKRP
jgi:hypothetical protein